MRRWQELQVAQVAGDVERLAWLRRYAAAQSKAEDASDEWRLLADEAGRYADRQQKQHGVQPSVQVGGDTVPLDIESASEPVSAPDSMSAPEPVPGGRRRMRVGPLIWVVILVGWVVLQILQGGGDGSP